MIWSYNDTLLIYIRWYEFSNNLMPKVILVKKLSEKSWSLGTILVLKVCFKSKKSTWTLDYFFVRKYGPELASCKIVSFSEHVNRHIPRPQCFRHHATFHEASSPLSFSSMLWSTLDSFDFDSKFVSSFLLIMNACVTKSRRSFILPTKINKRFGFPWEYLTALNLQWP